MSSETTESISKHILTKINESSIGNDPFFHLYIENIFPDSFYNKLQDICYSSNINTKLIPRTQDNKNFINNRFPIYNSSIPELNTLITLFESNEIKTALTSKFYIEPSKVASTIKIHQNECEFIYNQPYAFQNIHTDIPSKILSLVFYFPIPDQLLSLEDQYNNGTILYDTKLIPHKKTKYIPNSICIFTSGFHSYHGFNTTINRTALVMFYLDSELHKKHEESITTIRNTKKEIVHFKNNMKTKLQKHHSIEYLNKNLNIEMNKCKVNAKLGRVIL